MPTVIITAIEHYKKEKQELLLCQSTLTDHGKNLLIEYQKVIDYLETLIEQDKKDHSDSFDAGCRFDYETWSEPITIRDGSPDKETYLSQLFPETKKE